MSDHALPIIVLKVPSASMNSVPCVVGLILHHKKRKKERTDNCLQ